MRFITFREIRTNMKFCLSGYEIKNIKLNNDRFFIIDNSGSNFVANYLVLENNND